MSSFKIIFVGAEGAGKSTAIKTISGNGSNEVQSGLGNILDNATAPVTVKANPDGFVDPSGSMSLLMYEANKSTRFDASQAGSTAAHVGVILLINNTHVDFQSSLWVYWDRYTQWLPEVPIAIGITHMDINNKPTLADYHDQLRKTAIKPPIFTVDARSKADVALLVQSAWCVSRIR